MTTEVSLYDAKTHLSALVERAAGGEEIVITKRGAVRAKLVPVPATPSKREWGKNVLGVTWIADDFNAPDPEIVALFNGEADDDDLV
jgi:prevent-host-death family protein